MMKQGAVDEDTVMEEIGKGIACSNGTPQVVEICCGSAVLSRAFIDKGITALGVDCLRNRHSAQAPWVTVDMTDAGAVESIMGILESCQRLQLVWLGLPYGTTSRAREIQWKPGLPQPVRSPEEPWGITTRKLNEYEQISVDASNKVYLAGLAICKWCVDAGVDFVIENPGNSLLWYMPEFASMLDWPMVNDAEYDACELGGERKNAQRLRTNSAKIVSKINGRKCTGNHFHKPWREGDELRAKKEAQYPAKFAREIAGLYKCKEGAAEPVCGKAQAAVAAARTPAPGCRIDKASAGTQPRTSKFPQLVAEYKNVVVVSARQEDMPKLQAMKDSNKGWTTTDVKLINGKVVPKNVRILKVEKQGKGREESHVCGGGQESKEPMQDQAGKRWNVWKAQDCGGSTAGQEVNGANDVMIQYGVPWNPEVFAGEAAKVVHPFDGKAEVHDRIRWAIFVVLTKGPAAIKEHRRSVLARWQARARELDAEEIKKFDEAHEAVKPCWSNGGCGIVKGVWKGKRTLLLEEMAAEAGVPNPQLIGQYLRGGAPVCGRVPRSGLYGRKSTEATKTIDEVLKAAKWSKPTIRATTRPHKDPNIDVEVLARTEEEVVEGKAIGPLKEEEVDAVLGKAWAPVRRVGLVQGSGVRPIDDFSEYGHNATSSTDEHVDLGGVDAVVNMAKQWFEACKEDGTVRIELKSGERFVGQLHSSYGAPGELNLEGRALDLQRAFKQLAIAPAQRPLAVISLWHHKKEELMFYMLRALPFGARNAVFVFGSVARCLELILVVLFYYTVTQYVDDYPQLEPQKVHEGGVDVAEVLDLLGWSIKKFEDKIPCFGSSFPALGVVFDLSRQKEKKVVVANKPERAAKVSDLVASLKAGPRPSTRTAETLRGVLGWARAQCFGRCGAVAVHILAQVVSGKLAVLDGAARAHLDFWPIHLRKAQPRIITVGDMRRPALIFTDGSEVEVEERKEVGVGAMLIDDGGVGREAFGGLVSDSIIKQWIKDGPGKKVIHQAEVYPVLLCALAWGRQLAGRRILVFVDNDAARTAVIKGDTRSLASARITHQFWERAATHEWYPWIDRVPSKSNPADGPSRGVWDEVERMGARRIPMQGLTDK